MIRKIPYTLKISCNHPLLSRKTPLLAFPNAPMRKPTSTAKKNLLHEPKAPEAPKIAVSKPFCRAVNTQVIPPWVSTPMAAAATPQKAEHQFNFNLEN
jgi:hypothetical protein